MKLHWMKTGETWPKGTWPENHSTCFDDAKPWRKSNGRQQTDIGSAHQIRDGRDAGKWSWSMTAWLPRPNHSGSTSGMVASREEVIRLMVKSYESMLAYYNRHRPDG